ncbi:MAG: transposase [Patescibacteria group bacterium]|nr:transposase [Patescibacteria group bacterium]
MFPIVAERYKYVAGVDTHAKKHVVTIVNNLGAVLVTREVKVTPKHIESFIDWVIKITNNTTGNSVSNNNINVLLAVEGTSSYGETLTKAAMARGLDVAEIKPPKTKSRGGAGKTDLIDSRLAATSVLSLPIAKLAMPRTGNERKALRILLGARRNLVTQQTMNKNALMALIRSIELGIDARKPLTASDYKMIVAWRIKCDTNSVDWLTAKHEVKRLAIGIVNADTELDKNKLALTDIINKIVPNMLDQPGIGPVSLAQVICSYSYKGRIHSAEAFAALAGTTPIPASSGNTNHYRLNHYGDRQLNHALTTIVISRMRTNELTKQYVIKRTSDGLGTRDIKRSLKRYVARSLFKQLENYNI